MSAIAMIGVLSVADTDWRTPLSMGFVDGETQRQLENAFDQGVVVRSISISGWTTLKYLLFGETLPGAVAGHAGWLFTDEEYTAAPGFEERRAIKVAQIISTVNALSDKGTHTTIALLPDKARVMTEYLAKPRAKVVDGRYDATLSDLSAAGLQVIDLRKVLLAAKANGQVFMRTDTHWSPHGARAVAVALAASIKENTEQRMIFVTEFSGLVGHKGDLLSFVNIEPFSRLTGISDEEILIFETSSDTGLGLFDDVAVPATLIGTSYSAMDQWNFVGFLKQSSQTDVLNRAENGRGPFAPMNDFLTQLIEGNVSADVVIWEIPERYLTMSEVN
ncbi:MAG: alginate O-acetyltransferase AlgX-related protein [Marinosulfonomonas sp.]